MDAPTPNQVIAGALILIILIAAGLWATRNRHNNMPLRKLVQTQADTAYRLYLQHTASAELQSALAAAYLEQFQRLNAVYPNNRRSDRITVASKRKE